MPVPKPGSAQTAGSNVGKSFGLGLKRISDRQKHGGLENIACNQLELSNYADRYINIY